MPPMLWETPIALLIGLLVAVSATRWRPSGFPLHRLVWATGPGAALVGWALGRGILGQGHSAATLAVSLTVSVVLVSLLFRSGSTAPAGRPRETRAV
ncbi:hypothetical protein GCM10027160_53080 [Streptomyces calidiresistens]|uniref:Integral membrane protein n=1 Tax=Streptomyces calidiresistens TaxID=1485586 RepID=A0A7W3T619_9ACTN|nr:hypothetical protein [Streptomyces calidiresistens]MBB0231602.1 hypothetical protein [Streptomyces calidiresistens]